ncbi:MAG: glycosyltransferase family 2 protein [Candidatus Binatia bacterium]
MNGPAGEAVTIVIPAFNEPSVGALVRELRRLHPSSPVLVVDDGSTDGTADAAREAGARVVRHPYNKGNGAAVKTGLRRAETDWVVLVDADGQHLAEDVARLLAPLGEFDLVIGAREASAETLWWRRLANAVYNRLASWLVGFPIADLTSGFRAARRAAMLEFVHLFPNGFSYPATSTLSFLRAGYDVAFVPVHMPSRSEGTSKIRLFRDGTRFLLIILKLVTLYSPLKVFAPISAAFAVLGTVYGLWAFWASGRFANGALLAWMMATFVFLVGLISEQINALRIERREH